MHQARSIANRRAGGQHKIIRAPMITAMIVGAAPNELIAEARPTVSPDIKAISYRHLQAATTRLGAATDIRRRRSVGTRLSRYR